MTPTSDSPSPVTVRFFAAAREAVGQDQVQVSPGGTLPQLLDALIQSHGHRTGQVMDLCTFLVDGSRTAATDPTTLTPGVTVDVLPPFAGG